MSFNRQAEMYKLSQNLLKAYELTTKRLKEEGICAKVDIIHDSVTVTNHSMDSAETLKIGEILHEVYMGLENEQT